MACVQYRNREHSAAMAIAGNDQRGGWGALRVEERETAQAVMFCHKPQRLQEHFPMINCSHRNRLGDFRKIHCVRIAVKVSKKMMTIGKIAKESAASTDIAPRQSIRP
jgi:hypothetical protein